ncbi:molybdate ABC transporter substrate-binding protein [uncultured Pseudodesulfovibrio sp.]|uniref:molybdate ABC transporter substrate-binding protein n=1 Tax=uncultured Pseudodesulfovibrio sp. TaxID=2035858 RepID=UPI0029C97309|nr:molybdate ABC transporter substrate-binding protein [uncultured Pseudodesulfovibrio sp.]
MLKKFVYITLWIALLVSPAHAATLKVACAANFTSAMKELSAQYTKESGNKVNCTFGSTGMLYGQITKGAPYDLFFAADEKRPALLHDKGLGNTPELYAKGRVVVWSKSEKLAIMSNWKEVVLCSECRKVGIATPKTAPYGLKAEEAMKQTHVFTDVEPRLAFGKSVGMAFQYAYSGATDASFVALSQALSGKAAQGRYWPVPEAGPVNQAASVLKNGDTTLATAFLAWMKTPEAHAIVEKYGYE